LAPARAHATDPQAAHLRHVTRTRAPHTQAPTLEPTSTPPVSWQKTAESYAYYADIYYERAAFDYANFPYGPSFDNAEEDMATARYYEAKAKAEYAAQGE
jgi:hypothetical protein